MHSQLPRLMLTAACAAMLLTGPALLPVGTSHAAGPGPIHRLLPVRGAAHDTGSVAIAGIPFAAANVDASTERGPQSETSIAASPVNASSLVAGSNDIAGTSMNAYSSLDGGQTWRRVALPPHNCSGGNTSDPALGANLAGEYFYAYLSYGCPNNYAEVTVGHSTDGGLTWTPVTAFRDFINGPDKEQIAVDRGANSPTKGRIYVSWDENLTNGTQLVALVWSDDNGVTWHAPVRVDLGDSGGVIYATPAVGPDGHVYVIWDDYGFSPRGRFSVIRFAAASNAPAPGYTPAFGPGKTLALTGINLFNPGPFTIPAQPDRGIAADPSLNVDRTGRIYALWTQGIRGSAVTDVKVQTSTDGGATWSKPVQVNDDNSPTNFTTGSSDFFPWGAIDAATNAFHVSFYSTRGDATNRTTNVYTSVSTNGGATFGANTRITTVASNESATNPARDLNNYGDYEGLVIQGGKEHPVWTDTRYISIAGEEIFSASH